MTGVVVTCLTTCDIVVILTTDRLSRGADMTATPGTMAGDRGTEYVARWVQEILTKTRCEWREIRVAVAGAYYDGTDASYVPSADVTIEHIGGMTPEQTQKALAKIHEFDAMLAADGKPLPTGRHCKLCGAAATMAASLGPACDLHYDDLS